VLVTEKIISKVVGKERWVLLEEGNQLKATVVQVYLGGCTRNTGFKEQLKLSGRGLCNRGSCLMSVIVGIFSELNHRRERPALQTANESHPPIDEGSFQSAHQIQCRTILLE
jgi:hypothetical protein